MTYLWPTPDAYVVSPELKIEGGKAVWKIEVGDNSNVHQEGLDFISEYQQCFYQR